MTRLYWLRAVSVLGVVSAVGVSAGCASEDTTPPAQAPAAGAVEVAAVEAACFGAIVVGTAIER